MKKVEMTYNGKRLFLKNVVEVWVVNNQMRIFYKEKIKRAPEVYEMELIDTYTIY